MVRYSPSKPFFGYLSLRCLLLFPWLLMMWNYFNALARCMQNREKFTNVQCMMATDCRVKRDRNRRRGRESELVQKWKESNGKYRNHSIERHTIFVCETIERKNAAQNVYVHKYINCFAFAVLLSIYNWERLSKWEIEHFSIRWLIFFRSLSLSLLAGLMFFLCISLEKTV